MAHDVFISYSSRDQQVADDVCATLESNGFTCWIASRDISPGELYSQAIVKGIGKARLMVLIFSSHANESDDVLGEVDIARGRGIPIIRFLIEDVPLSEGLQYYLRTSHWLKALPLPPKNYLPTLVESVRRRLEQLPAPTQTTAAAPPPPTSVEKIVGSTPSVQPTVTAPSSIPAEKIEAATSHVSMGQRSAPASNPLLRVGVIVSAIALLGLIWFFFIKPRGDDVVTNTNSKPGITFNMNRVLTRNTNTGTAAKGVTDGDAKTENANSATVNNVDTGGETSGRVLLYYSKAVEANMQKVRQALRDEKYMVLSSPLPDPAPDNSEVRYYFSVDKESAERVNDIIARTLGIKLNVNPRLGGVSTALRHSKGEIVIYLK